MIRNPLRNIRWGLLPVVFALAWPTMLEQLMQTAVQYIDTAMVGSLGTPATAAVGATTTINWLIGGSVSALGIGFLSYIARACGENNREKAARAAAQAVLVVLITGVFFTVLTLSLSGQIPRWMQVDSGIRADAASYFFILYAPMLPRTASIIFGTLLRASGDTRTPMRVGIWVNLINVVLNFLLIYETRELSLFGWHFTMYGAGLGTDGAALASAAAYTFGGVRITAALWKHPLISPKGHSMRPDGSILRPCLRIALPNMLQRFGTSLGYVAFAAMINSLGEISTAAHTIANTVESAFYIPGYGMQAAAATLAGNALGMRSEQRMKDITAVIVVLETGLMVITGGLLFLFAPDMVSIFSKSGQVIWLGSVVLRMVALSEPFYGVSIVIEGMMQGVGETVRPFIFNIVGMWGVRIVGTAIFTQFLGGGLISAWGCMIAHNMLLFSLFLIHYLRGGWDPLRRNAAASE